MCSMPGSTHGSATGEGGRRLPRAGRHRPGRAFGGAASCERSATGCSSPGSCCAAASLAIALLADAIQIQKPERMRVRDAFAAARGHVPLRGRQPGARRLQPGRPRRPVLAADRAGHGGAHRRRGHGPWALAGYFRVWDEPIMRVMDALMAFPAILLAVAITAALGPSATNAVIALAAVYTPRTARILRASILVVRELEYVQAVYRRPAPAICGSCAPRAPELPAAARSCSSPSCSPTRCWPRRP